MLVWKIKPYPTNENSMRYYKSRVNSIDTLESAYKEIPEDFKKEYLEIQRLFKSYDYLIKVFYSVIEQDDHLEPEILNHLHTKVNKFKYTLCNTDLASLRVRQNLVFYDYFYCTHLDDIDFQDYADLKKYLLHCLIYLNNMLTLLFATELNDE